MIALTEPDFASQQIKMFASQQDFVDYSVETCGGPVGKLFGEWRDVQVKSSTAMHMIQGIVAASEFSGSDFWGTHRYRDWNVLIVPYAEFNRLLAPADFLDLGWDDDPIAQDLRVNNPDLPSLFEAEWDTGFFPPEMAPESGDETIIVGRWVFDCGHEGVSHAGLAQRPTGYRTEIHAPAILVSGHVLERNSSSIRARFKAFAGSRSGPLDTVPLLFYIQKFWSSHLEPLGGRNYSVELRSPQHGWKIASCSAGSGVGAGGKRHRISKTLESKDGGESLTLTLSTNNFKPTSRIENSTIVEVTWVPAKSWPNKAVTKCD